MNDPLHIGDRLSEGMEAFMNNALEMILGFFLMILIGSVSCGICFPPLIVGYHKMQLAIARGEKVSGTDLFQGFEKFGPAIIAAILIVIGVVLGSIVIVGGLVVAFLTYWTFMEIADGNDDPFDAMKVSMDFNMANIGPAIIFMIVVGVVASAGSLVALGSLITGPIAISAQAHAWKAFKEQRDGVTDTIPQPVPDEAPAADEADEADEA
ncbi:MAG: hypothetical protein GY898_28860 [Proteobacteria bacterium]|nr:hypothetical protein [Pseudomonadota bacterium]